MDSSSSFLGLFRDFSKLAVIQSVIKAAFCDQFIMSTLLNNVAVLHNKDQICVSDRREAVSYDKACPALHKACKGFLYLYLGSGVDRGGSLVKDKNRRIADCRSCNGYELTLTL